MLPQILPFAVAFLVFVGAWFAPSKTKAQDGRRPTQSSLVAIAQRVSANANLPMITDLPAIELVRLRELGRLRDKGSSAFYSGGGPAAVYDDTTSTTYLPEIRTGNLPGEVSVPVHEGVHNMQDRAGDMPVVIAGA